MGRVACSVMTFTEGVGVAKNQVRRKTENAERGLFGDVIVGLGVTDGRRQDEADFTEFGFLVGAHGIEKRGGSDRGPLGKRTDSADERDDARGEIFH